MDEYIIPDRMPSPYQDTFGFDLDLYSTAHEARQKHIKEGGFAFVSWRWVNPFVEWIGNRRCLEVMAGRGVLAYALRQKGVNVIVTDDYSWFNGRYDGWNKTLVDVEKIDAIAAVKKYGKEIDILIMSWPYMDNTAYRVIKELYAVNPKAVVVYIGEGPGGCTADDEFHNHFEEIGDKSFNRVVACFERWNGLHDKPYLGRYAEEVKMEEEAIA
jgi:hypothetical protein